MFAVSTDLHNEVGTHVSNSVQKTLFAKPKPGAEKQEEAPFIRMHQIGNSVHELLFSGLTDPSFVPNAVSAVVGAGEGRGVTDAEAKHNAGNFHMTRTVKRISNPIPYSLPLGLAG